MYGLWKILWDNTWKALGADFVQKIFLLLTGLLIILGGKSILADEQNKDIQNGKIRKNKKKSFVV
jgi:hypothetical protein